MVGSSVYLVTIILSDSLLPVCCSVSHFDLIAAAGSKKITRLNYVYKKSFTRQQEDFTLAEK